MTTVDPSTQAPFRQSYPIDFHLYNDDGQEALNITDDPAGQNLHLEVSNASGQNINLLAPSNTTASANNYHFALRFRPDTLSLPFQTYAAFAADVLSKPQAQTSQTQPQMSLALAFQQFVAPPQQGASHPTALPVTLQSFVAAATPAPQGTQPNTGPSALQAFAVDTASTLQGSLQQQGWNLGYQQEADGTTVVYFLSTQARTLAPAAKVAVTLPHISASSAEGARGTRVELLYQQLTFGNDTTPLSGHRQIYLSIVNQQGQKQIPLHVSFVGFNSILNDGKTLNTLTLRIINVLKDGPIALNPASSSAPSKFILSFDVQQDNNDADWTLGTASEVGAIVIAPVADWSITPPTGQEELPEWIVTPVSKTLLAADEALQLTLSNIITSSSGQTNLYVRYENIPGYWDGQFVVTIEKTPLLYRGSYVGIGTIAPDRPLTIRGANTSEELLSFENAAGTTTWHINQHLSGSGLNFVETGVADGRLYIQAGGHVGIGTTTPVTTLDVKGNDFQISATNAQNHHWGLVNWIDDRLYFQYRDTSTTTNAMWLDNKGVLTVGSLAVGGNTFQQGVNWTGVDQVQFSSPGSGTHNIAPLVSSNAIRILGGDGGVLATNAGDVLAWASYGIVIKGDLWARNKNFLIDHPTKPDHHLIHACLEGPESAVYYRGESQLEHGRATIQLPNYFEALTRKEGRTVVLTPKGREPFLLSYEDIVDGVFKIYGTKSDGEFSWEVKAVRADVGKLEVEIKK